jgi:molybdopterin biosynthesis enzyme MoaB
VEPKFPQRHPQNVAKGMLTKEIPGIIKLIRIKYGMEKPKALVSQELLT